MPSPTKNLLIIDDEKDFVTLMKLRLEAAGFTVLTSHSGQQGVTVAQKKSPDLIILDIMMPIMDGFEVCKILRHTNDCRYTPIIMLTAKDTPKDREFGLNVGASVYLTKPFGVQKLIEQIRKLLGMKELQY